MFPQPAGKGKKHPQLDISISQLFLDNENPRLPEETQGKNQSELLKVLYQDFSLGVLAESMANNGYFDEEPLVAIPINLPAELETCSIDSSEFNNFISKPETKFTVVEGNRRLATAKLLLDQTLRESLKISKWPIISPVVEKDLSILPVIIYQKRVDVIPYLGVRHIVGIQKWEAYAKARYIAKMIESGYSLEEIERQIGDQSGALIKNYLSYKIVEQAVDEFDFNLQAAKKDFSFLLLAIGQGNIKRYLGLPQKLSEVNPKVPIGISFLGNLKNILNWLYGIGKKRPAINESRDITNYLSAIVTSQEAVEYLEVTNNIIEAYDRTDGEEKMLLKYLKSSNQKMETALSLVHRHKTPEIIAEIEKCNGNVKALLKMVEG